MLEIIIWILGTLLILTICVTIAKKYGYVYVIGLFSALYVIANVLANKIVQVGPYSVTAGIIVYSLTFYLTDFLSEIYGKKIAKQAVWVGFLSQIILVFSIWVAIQWSPAPFWKNQGAFVTILSNTPRIVMASLVTYLVSQHHDVWAYHYWRKITRGKHLWIRNNASTIVSQAIDSTLFVFLAFYGIFSLSGLWNMIVGAFIIKMGIAVLDTPFLYAARRYYKTKIKGVPKL
ncbi:MAG: queuosine precursor transporter [Candidatus Heimdallarchaeaceae archaeon]